MGLPKRIILLPQSPPVTLRGSKIIRVCIIVVVIVWNFVVETMSVLSCEHIQTNRHRFHNKYSWRAYAVIL